MTAPIPLLIVSLPARSVAEAREEIRLARQGGADAAEIRFDRWPGDERANVAQLFPAELPLVATLRSRAEGGDGPDDVNERQREFATYAQHPFAFIDRELARDSLELPPFRGSSPHAATPTMIVSQHMRAPPAPHELRELLRRPPASGQILKIVLPASLDLFFRQIVPELLPSGELAYLVHTTGGSGPLLRAWARRFGFPIVFAALPDSKGASPSPAPVEAAQIPVDRLRRYLVAPDSSPLFAVVGHPIDHSSSPVIHSRWMRESGHAGLYVALDISSEEEFVAVLPSLAEAGVAGLNVTHPFKPVTLKVADHIGRSAESAGCANVLTLRRGEVEAENTDVAAVVRRLEELKSAGQWDGKELTILGAGGAARATLVAAQSLGAFARLTSRNARSAASLAQEFGVSVSDTPTGSGPGLVVNATPIGRRGEGPLDKRWENFLVRGGYVLDFVYSADEPYLAEAARRVGAEYEDGWRLLVYQAAASYALWWPDGPPEESVAALAEEGPCTA
ncbi:MAG: type I 3-dehydroquinate dehydratase [Thermoplasmata archaeon]